MCRQTLATVIARSAQRDEAISATDWATAIWRNETKEGAVHVLAKRTRDHRAQNEVGKSLMAVQQQAGVARQNPLPVCAQRANLGNEFRHARGVADLLRIIGAEDATRRRQL